MPGSSFDFRVWLEAQYPFRFQHGAQQRLQFVSLLRIAREAFVHSLVTGEKSFQAFIQNVIETPCFLQGFTPPTTPDAVSDTLPANLSRNAVALPQFYPRPLFNYTKSASVTSAIMHPPRIFAWLKT
jgi:hypothetical protein